MPAVELEEISRVFEPRKKPKVVALDEVSLTIPPGEIHGLLGPNGAGKTTLVKILSTVLLPTSGRARVLGHDVVADTKAVRPLLGIVSGGERGLYWRQRLHLARGLIGDANVLFLDEPTTGMDPLAAREFRTLIAELRDEGKTILVATHDMVEAETVCDRVTLIDRGKIVATESPRTLGRVITRFQRIDVEGVGAAVLGEIRTIAGVSSVTAVDGGGARIEVDEEGATLVVLARVVEAGATSVKTSLPSLEEVYVQLIGDRGLEL